MHEVEGAKSALTTQIWWNIMICEKQSTLNYAEFDDIRMFAKRLSD